MSLVIREGAGEQQGLRGSGIPLSASPVSGCHMLSLQSGFFYRVGGKDTCLWSLLPQLPPPEELLPKSQFRHPAEGLQPARCTDYRSHTRACLGVPWLSSEKASVVSWAAIPEGACHGDSPPAEKSLLRPGSRCWALLHKGTITEKELNIFKCSSTDPSHPSPKA